MITGPSAKSVGAQTAIDLAYGKPAHLILTGRTLAKIKPVIAEINSISPETKVDFVPLDLSSQASVRDAATAINSKTSKIDILINNAGIMGLKEYSTTAEGIEMQFGTNHIGHFLLTGLLLPKILEAGKGARIVNISSSGYALGGVRFDSYNFDDGKSYNPWFAYSQSKTANLLFTISLAEMLKDKGIFSFAATPGLILETNLQADVTPEMYETAIKAYKDVYAGREMPPTGKPKPLAASASTTLVAALDPGLESHPGAFLDDCQPRTDVEPHGKSKEDADHLWSLSESLVGDKFSI